MRQADINPRPTILFQTYLIRSRWAFSQGVVAADLGDLCALGTSAGVSKLLARHYTVPKRRGALELR
jgi:demethoxyubiquinone hydroxylase (CLK1/Coq7/Cat5 family)